MIDTKNYKCNMISAGKPIEKWGRKATDLTSNPR